MIDFAKIEQYRKNNRIEAKKVIGGCPKAYGKPTTPLPTHGGIILLAVEEVPDKSHCTIDLLDLDRLIKEFWDIVNAPVKTSVNILFAKDVFVQEVEADHIIVINSLRTERSDGLCGWQSALPHFRNGEGDNCCTREEHQAMVYNASVKIQDMLVLNQMDLDFFLYL